MRRQRDAKKQECEEKQRQEQDMEEMSRHNTSQRAIVFDAQVTNPTGTCFLLPGPSLQLWPLAFPLRYYLHYEPYTKIICVTYVIMYM
jgi:hypothetical protein